MKTVMFFIAGLCAVAATNPTDTLYSAIRGNDLAALRALLKDPANVNLKDDRGMTPLMCAAFAGSSDAMKLLLDNGADVNATNGFGSTSLMWSVTDFQKVRML